jgi:hypothetical protein
MTTRDPIAPCIIDNVYYAKYPVAFVSGDFAWYEAYLKVLDQKNDLVWGIEKYRKMTPDDKEQEWSVAKFAGSWKDLVKQTLYLSEEGAFFEGDLDRNILNVNFVGNNGSSFKARFQRIKVKSAQETQPV